MAEVLTESFCERCGTRYTFEATGRRRRGLGRIRALSRGVKNFVSNDDESFSEAMAAAHADDERSQSSQQLDAFHRTFNFCMSCRQYTCGNCWNTTASECLSCAPNMSLEVLPPTFPDLAIGGPGAHPSAVAEPAHTNVEASAWPTSDLHAAHTEAVVAGPPATEPMDTSEIELTHEERSAIEGALSRYDAGPTIAEAKNTDLADRAGPADADVAAIPPIVGEGPVEAPSAGRPEPAGGARRETRHFMQRFRPHRNRPTPVATPTAPAGPSADAAAAEPAPGAVEAEPAPEAVVAEAVEAVVAEPAPEAAAAEPAPEAVVPEPAPEAVVAEPAPEAVVAEAPEAVVAEPAPEAVVAEAPEAPPTDVVVQPTWRMVAEDGAAPGEPHPAPPAWASPESATRRATDAMPSASWAARVATARPLESPVWAESSRDILAAGPRGAAGPVGIQSCVSCGLSLSANARFCRRCGSRQG
jgi:hypothetical protein